MTRCVCVCVKCIVRARSRMMASPATATPPHARAHGTHAAPRQRTSGLGANAVSHATKRSPISVTRVEISPTRTGTVAVCVGVCGRVRRERGASSERASPSPSTPRNPHPPPPHTHAHTPPTADAGNVRVGLQQVDDREAIGARAERLCRRRGRDEHDGRVARLHQRAHVHVLEALWGGRAALLSRYLAAPSAVESAAWGVAAWRARCTHTISTHPRR